MIILRQKSYTGGVGKSNPALNFMNQKGNGQINKVLKRQQEAGITNCSPKNFQQYAQNNPQKVASKVNNFRASKIQEPTFMGGAGYNSNSNAHAGLVQPALVNNATSYGYAVNTKRYDNKKAYSGNGVGNFNPKQHLNPRRVGDINNIDSIINANAKSAEASKDYAYKLN